VYHPFLPFSEFCFSTQFKKAKILLTDSGGDKLIAASTQELEAAALSESAFALFMVSLDTYNLKTDTTSRRMSTFQDPDPSAPSRFREFFFVAKSFLFS
jgi:hypothetical protein